MTTSICAGLFLSIQGTAIDNDSFVDVDDIGASSSNPDNRLLCLTNATNCCAAPNGQGNWLLPDGTVPPFIAALGGDIGFARERGPSVVRLYRQGSPPERGRFRCVLLGDTVYANICE